MESEFEILLNEEGVFLRVMPSCSASLGDVTSALKGRGIEDYDGRAVSAALNDKLDTPVKIAEPSAQVAQDADLRIRISDDVLKCEVWLIPPRGSGAWPTLEKVRGLMATHGVNFGIKDEAISEMIEGQKVRQWVMVAEGNPCIMGKDARIECKVDVGGSHPRVVGDNVDMRELGSVINVLQGQEIAEKIPLAPGADGMNVLGKKITCYVGRDRPLTQGKGTILSEDGLHLFADVSGNLVTNAGIYSVIPSFNVSGDVDYGVGNIDFVGPVAIKGSIREGFEVSCGGDLSVGGVVEGATVSSSGNMQIKVGIRGTGKAKISCGADIAVGYIDQAHVRAMGNIDVAEAILHSDIGAAGTIKVLGSKKGQIAGGRVQAGVEVVCEVLGSEMGTRTDVTVGVLPELAEERKRCLEIVRELRERLNAIEANITFLKELQRRGQLGDKRTELLAKITKAKFQIKAQTDSSERRIAEIEAEMEKNKADGCVRVRNTCHSGVSITIRGVKYLVREQLRFTRFIYEDGEIKLRSFD